MVGDEGEVDSALRFLIGEREAFGRDGRVGFEEGGAGTISSNGGNRIESKQEHRQVEVVLST